MPNRNWTREEHILAFNLYCKLPFGKYHKGNPEVIALARLIGRTPSSVGMKLGNLARLDPSLQARGIGGLANGAKGEEEVWNEFHGNWDALAWESEQILARRQAKPIEEVADLSELKVPEEGLERETVVKTRVNQGFFRQAVLSAYKNTCCITGLALPPLLIASHIIPWAQAEKAARVNPSNGLCLNALHDRAFDRGLLTIADDYTIVIGDALLKQKEPAVVQQFHAYHGQPMQLPDKFYPDPRFLAWHRNHIFVGQAPHRQARGG